MVSFKHFNMAIENAKLGEVEQLDEIFGKFFGKDKADDMKKKLIAKKQDLEAKKAEEFEERKKLRAERDKRQAQLQKEIDARKPKPFASTSGTERHADFEWSSR
jgi:hypothetical protein